MRKCSVRFSSVSSESSGPQRGPSCPGTGGHRPRNEEATMLLLLLCFHCFSRVVSEALPPPQNVHMEKGQLTWTPASEEPDITYTVQQHSLDSKQWNDVPSCERTFGHVCNISTSSQLDCVSLRVHAERQGLRSKHINACSVHGDSCSPAFSLTPRPGSLTVQLKKDHDLAKEYADHAKYRIYFGREGELLQHYEDSTSSETISELQQGQRYCVRVEYTVYSSSVGVAGCMQCAVIPASGEWNKTATIVGVIAGVLVLFLFIPLIAYVLLFHQERIKRCLRPSYELPERFYYLPIITPVSSPPEEHWSAISVCSPYESRGG